ncbi:MAG TPA: hypothetical protein VML96_06815 [Egibacteraceae bacterium]|nr:hypothetical protein [Egibacteraceae bacterium]
MDPVAIGLFVGVPLSCALFILLLSRRPITVFVKEGSRTLTVVGDEIVDTSYETDTPASAVERKPRRVRSLGSALRGPAIAARSAVASAARRVSPARAVSEARERVTDRRVQHAFESAFTESDRGELSSEFRRIMWEQQVAGAQDLYFHDGAGLRFALHESLQSVLEGLVEQEARVRAIIPPDSSGLLRISFDDGCEFSLLPWDRAAGRLLASQIWHGPVSLSGFNLVGTGSEHEDLRLIFDTVEGSLPLRARQLALI